MPMIDLPATPVAGAETKLELLFFKHLTKFREEHLP
jgi:hypothetical protein